jgi:uncharacterized protein YprB with RNaseH-like and TPR domain
MPKPASSGPRIIFYDIETAPSLGYFFDKYKENNIVATVRDWFMLSFSYKVKGEKKIHYHCLADYPGYDRDRTNDKALVTDIHRLVFSQADCLIGHNIVSFDARKARTKFITHNLPPVFPAKTIDTLKLFRRLAKFDSNRLNDLGEALGLGGKLVHTGWDLWKRCINGDRKAWAQMGRYNKRDVDLLEKVYERIAPWHPSPPILVHGDGCPTCHSHKVQRRGWNIARKSRTARMQCQDCGQWFSGNREAIKV